MKNSEELTTTPLPSAYATSSREATWRCVMRAPLIFCASALRSYLGWRGGGDQEVDGAHLMRYL